MSKSLLALCAVALLAWALAQPNMHSLIAELDEECEQSLNKMWNRYTNASAPINGCDPECLKNCKSILYQALEADNANECPPQSEIQRCFSYRKDAWEAYAAQCALFKFGAAEGGALEPTGEGEGEAGRRLLQEGEGEAADTSVDSSVSGGCFPPFADVEEFEQYIEGTYQFEKKSNAVGITLSVLFFTGLAAIGVFMKG